MIPVIPLPIARKEIEEAAAWHAVQRRGLALEFLEEVNLTFSRIAAFPASYPLVGPRKKLRSARVRRFRYLVVYRLRDSYVEVVMIIDERRHPDARIRRA